LLQDQRLDFHGRKTIAVFPVLLNDKRARGRHRTEKSWL